MGSNEMCEFPESARSVGTCTEALSEVLRPDCITILVTTSPIPSHPSPVLLRALFASFRRHLPSLKGCPSLIVCDGYRRADGKPQLCSEDAYNQFLEAVDERVHSGEFGACRVLKLSGKHGYGRALQIALAQVQTEFVLVMQHDWLFVKEMDMHRAVEAMREDPSIKYIGMQSMTTLDYARRMEVRYQITLPHTHIVAGVPLTPQLLWYDKPHLCRVSHYLNVVLKDAPCDVGEVPEARYGLALMWPALRSADNISDTHNHFGTFFWDVGAEVVYHLSGRKLHAEPYDSEIPELELRGAAHATVTYTAVAADRVAHIPGLSMPVKRESSSRFKGRCFLCGEKGHSKLNCALRGDVGPAQGQVLAGC